MSLTSIYENLSPNMRQVLKKTLVPIFKWSIIKPLEFWHCLNIKEEKKRAPILFVDITILHKSNSGTGIQRVVENILKNLQNLNLTHEVRPCFFKWLWGNGLYDCATQKNIKIQKDDIFLGLDLSTMQVFRNNAWLKRAQKIGVPLWFVLYDLFPITQPKHVDNGTVLSFRQWFFKTLPIMNGAISISQTTQNDLQNLIQTLPNSAFNPQMQSFFVHLGADFKSDSEPQNPPIPNAIPQFLAVSTVEPRKRYDLIVSAFEILWQRGINAHLHIVGKAGWKNDATIAQIENSPFLNQKLFWHKNHISDSELQALYQKCDACVFASDAEGFGLAVVEAAFYHKPLILRDIPVFHEVSQESAFFFKGDSPESFANDLKMWLERYEKGEITPPDIRIYTWRETAKETAQILGVFHGQP